MLWHFAVEREAVDQAARLHVERAIEELLDEAPGRPTNDK
jgi:hypothetical protein